MSEDRVWIVASVCPGKEHDEVLSQSAITER